MGGFGPPYFSVMFDLFDINYHEVATERWGLELTEPNEEGWCQGLCPFHPDTSPSFGFNINSGAFNCFAGCGSGSFAMMVERLGDSLEEITAYYAQSDVESIKRLTEHVVTPESKDTSVNTANYNISKWAYEQRKNQTKKYNEIEDTLEQFDWLVRTSPMDAVKFSESIISHDS